MAWLSFGSSFWALLGSKCLSKSCSLFLVRLGLFQYLLWHFMLYLFLLDVSKKVIHVLFLELATRHDSQLLEFQGYNHLLENLQIKILLKGCVPYLGTFGVWIKIIECLIPIFNSSRPRRSPQVLSFDLRWNFHSLICEKPYFKVVLQINMNKLR